MSEEIYFLLWLVKGFRSRVVGGREFCWVSFLGCCLFLFFVVSSELF